MLHGLVYTIKIFTMVKLSQQIRAKYQLGDVMHMTDVENLESILQEGKIFSNNQMKLRKLAFTDISNESVQFGRAIITVPCTGKLLHDYVPLYWGKKTPMVSALRNLRESLIFMMFSTDLLADYNCVVSDGNARSCNTAFKEFMQLSDLDILNPRDINTVKYASNAEIKRRKQSELLVLEGLPLKHLLYVVCYSLDVKLKVQALLTTYSLNCGVYIGKGNYYF